MLNERLKVCLDMVSGKGIVCDVGTDHAYLVTELILSGKCSRAIASDICESPLERAKANIEKSGISDKVELFLTDGLENIPSENVTDVVIAGMGGETIIHILEETEWIKKDVKLILQPMTKTSVLRKWLYENGYKITEEKAVRDKKFIYTVMSVLYCKDSVKLTEFASIIGKLDFSLDISKEYLNYQIKKFENISEGLKKSGQFSESFEKYNICRMLKLIYDFNTISGEDIYNTLDEFYPFNTQEKWDNSGYLTGNKGKLVNKILLSLDITKPVVSEAIYENCDMIISHHPVIFEPLKSINADSVVYKLIRKNISAICMHTNLDIAKDGTNGVIFNKLSERLEISKLEYLDEIGGICILKNPVSSEELAKILKDIFNCKFIKYCSKRIGISKIAFCSGSGSSMLGEVISKGCDAFITGDVKHDVWISANNQNFTIFDCGHFHTENLVLEHLKNVFDANFPFIETIISENSIDPVEYL